MRLEIGQTVQLKSGGPEMTIVGIGTDAGQQQIECAWSDGQTQHSAHFPPEALDTVRKLRLSQTNRWIGGVCGGIGEYLGVDANVVRLGMGHLGIRDCGRSCCRIRCNVDIAKLGDAQTVKIAASSVTHRTTVV
jgi:uncharacterized protein YodC (DUF2158 family)